ncbi:uncharacterized protein EV420DRAFT_1647323 [Desarmillaria tabescens]|uniref:F-box domain-containing protein n=1 Tax=Armillaria tabescens TaxID=1929756 RepID=A0AA39JXH8_ARMTA|nr:uncharacterized protein EV420DRAFT_1647323 [Desarmillaria tabescens]KAK0448423.1 hypothetical protein EV420DRAFT_1647323 [Desarmillaria tabescens]
MPNENFISRLNDDVLLEIFLHVCGEKPLNAYPKNAYPALRLSLVCSCWRAVSLYSRRLWTNITILSSTKALRNGAPGPVERAQHATIQEEITNLYIQRSQGLLISIFVCKTTIPLPLKGPPPSDWVFPMSDRQIDLLCQAAGWKEIHVLSRDVWWFGQEQSLRCLLETGARCLKALPNFRNLYLHGYECCYGLENGSPSPDFPFDKIRSLTFNGSPTRGDIEGGHGSIVAIRRALQRFPYVRDVILSVPRGDLHEYGFLPALSLSLLTSLTLWVDYTCQSKVKYYLSDLSLPCLRSFTLKYVNNIIQYPLVAKIVSDVLGTCSQSLRSFTLEKVPIRASSLIDILSVVPVSQALANYIEANPAFLPDLEAVEFIWQREDTGRKLEKALMDMVETRRACGRLRDATIGRLNPYEELSVDTNHRLAVLKRG